GDKNQADAAAADAMRGMFGLIDCKGLVRIGEGRKDEAPGIFEDEKVGTWREGSIPAAIAVDPIDGTTLTAKGLPGAISVLAAIAPSLPESGVDAYVGIGGSPEAVISAAAIKCLGGQQLCRMWPKDSAERGQLLEDNLCTEADLRKVWTVEMMAPGEHVIFAA